MEAREREAGEMTEAGNWVKETKAGGWVKETKAGG